MPAVIVVGTQWGDEGKGKIVDLLTGQADSIVRAQGGNNAGHTIVFGDEEYKLHLIPSGILREGKQCFIGAGTVIDPEVLVKEIEGLEERGIDLRGRLWISDAAHVIFPYHKTMDSLMERRKGSDSVGTTGRGIGPCYADKAHRMGIRMGELLRPNLFQKRLEWVMDIKNTELQKLYEVRPLDCTQILKLYSDYAEKLQPYITSVKAELNRRILAKENILFEGAQGTFLDNTSGTYPYVTSSSTLAGGVCAGAEVGPTQITHTLGVAKAYTTRVGNGPLPTLIDEEESFVCHERDREIGTTSGRKRRIGWFDAVVVREAVRMNGVNSIALTKLDVLDRLKTIKICTGYELDGEPCDHLPNLADDIERLKPIYEEVAGWQCDTSQIKTMEELPQKARFYLRRCEDLIGVPLCLVSTGPAREQTIHIEGCNPFQHTQGGQS